MSPTPYSVGTLSLFPKEKFNLWSCSRQQPRCSVSRVLKGINNSWPTLDLELTLRATSPVLPMNIIISAMVQPNTFKSILITSTASYLRFSDPLSSSLQMFSVLSGLRTAPAAGMMTWSIVFVAWLCEMARLPMCLKLDARKGAR